MAVWNPSTKRFVEDLVTPLHDADLNAAYDAAVADAKAAFSAGAGIAFAGGVISLAQQGASVGQTLTWNGSAYVPATPAAGGGGTTYAAGTGLTLIGNAFAADIGTGAGQVAAGNHTHGIYQLSSAKGQANGYAPLDGNAQLALATLSPGSGTAGQALVLSNGVWTPATLAAGTTYTGTLPISVSGSVVSVATATNSQLGVVRPDGSTIQISGGVITSIGGSGLPVAIDATLDGTSGQTAIDPSKSLIYLNPAIGFTDSSPAPYTLANASTSRWIWLAHIGAGVASISANVNGAAGTAVKLYQGDVIPIFYDSVAGTYRASGALDAQSLSAAGALAGTDVLVITQAGIDAQATLATVTAYGQSHFQSWTTAGRPSLGSQYGQGFNTTIGRFDFWNGATWNQHARVSDLSATSSQLFGGSGTDGVAAAVTVGSKLSLTAGTLDLNATTAAAAIYAIPAGERVVAVTGGSSAVVLTAADHLKTVAITGAVGSTLSVDGTTSAGWRAFVSNKSTGVATYSGISGDNGTTVIAPGAAATVYRVSGAFYATAAAGSSATSTAYSMGTSQLSGLSGNAVTLTFAPISGTWPTGVTLTVSQSGVTGSFSSTSLSPVSGTSTPVTCTFTPTATGTATFSVTSGGAMTNPANVTYSVVAAATAYTTSLSGTTGVVSTPMTLTFTPTSGGWPNSEVITPTLSGVSGTFSPNTVSTTAGLTSAVTCLFTPTATGTAALSSTTSPSMTNTTGLQNYTVTAAAATAYTSTVSGSSGAVGSPVTFTVTPTSGTWPVAEAVTLTNVGLTGTWASASGGTISGSVLTPTAGSAAASAQFTPSTAASGTINSTTSPSMTNTTGGLSYTALAVATSFGTSPTTVTVASGSPTTLTFAPSGGVWGPTETIGMALVTVAGAFSGTTNGTISGSGPYTITPTPGNSTNVTTVFTPSSANGTSGSITISGVNITATTTTVAVSVSSGTATWPTLPGTGLNSSTITPLWRLESDQTTGTSGGALTLVDQSTGGHNFAASVGVANTTTAGSAALAVETFAVQTFASCSGLLANPPASGWLGTALVTENFTWGVTFSTGATLPTSGNTTNDEYLLMTYNAVANQQGFLLFWERSTGKLKYQDRALTSAAAIDLGITLAANTLYRLFFRSNYAGSGNEHVDVFINGTKTTDFYNLGATNRAAQSQIAIGQSSAGFSAGVGAIHFRFHGSFCYSGAIPDANMIGAGSIDAFYTTKWA